MSEMPKRISGNAMFAPKVSRTTSDYIQPSEYFQFAEIDFHEGDLRGLINALGNIKRAIDSQLDINLERYGLLSLSQEKKWSFPCKIKIMQKLGVVSPWILQKINVKRISMEHYHKKPDKNDVKEFLDIAKLFLEIFKHRTRRIELYIDYDKDFALWMNTKDNKILIFENTELLYNVGGIHMLKDMISEKKITPIKIVQVTELNEWFDVCNKYLPK